MSNTLKDISGRIEPAKISVLRNIRQVADELGIHFFVMGAFARDVLFTHIHGILTLRATEDIDIAVEVASWETFRSLADTLIGRGYLTATRLPHRFDARFSPTIVDIVPYGELSDDLKQISWPPDHDRIMSVVGFEEAYRSAIRGVISKNPPLEILVPSIQGLALLKIISWDDAYPQRKRDAADLLFILKNCETNDTRRRLYETHPDLLKEEDYDTSIASVRLLGQEIARLCSMETIRVVKDILTRETDKNGDLKLFSHMGMGGSFRGNSFENVLHLLKKLLQGIQDEIQSNIP